MTKAERNEIFDLFSFEETKDFGKRRLYMILQKYCDNVEHVEDEDKFTGFCVSFSIVIHTSHEEIYCMNGEVYLKNYKNLKQVKFQLSRLRKDARFNRTYFEAWGIRRSANYLMGEPFSSQELIDLCYSLSNEMVFVDGKLRCSSWFMNHSTFKHIIRKIRDKLIHKAIKITNE